MDFLRQWAVSLIICGISAAVINLLSPRGSMEKTLRAVTGIFLVSAVCLPFAKLKNTEDILPVFSFESETIYAKELEEQMLDACKATVGKAVEAAAQELGIAEYDVNAEMDMDEEYCIIIQNIHIVAYGCTPETAADFEALSEKKTGVEVTVECG